MSFMDSLAQNPSGSSVYGSTEDNRDSDLNAFLSVAKHLKEQSLNDFKNKANFTNDMSLRQNHIARIFNPQSSSSPQNTQGMNTVMREDPDRITPFQQAGLNIRKEDNAIDRQRVGLEGRRIGVTEKLGQERQDLNELKNENIRSSKQADMERKVSESNAKIELANKKLEQAGENSAAQLEAHKAIAAAVEERHKLELAHKDSAFEENKRMHDAQIKALQDKSDQAANSETTTEVDESGKKKTVSTRKGSKIRVIGKDGNPYNISPDKLDDWKANHAGE